MSTSVQRRKLQPSLSTHATQCDCYDYKKGHLCKHVHKVQQMCNRVQGSKSAFPIETNIEQTFFTPTTSVLSDECGSQTDKSRDGAMALCTSIARLLPSASNDCIGNVAAHLRQAELACKISPISIYKTTAVQRDRKRKRDLQPIGFFQMPRKPGRKAVPSKITQPTSETVVLAKSRLMEASTSMRRQFSLDDHDYSMVWSAESALQDHDYESLQTEK
eukprot:m.139897 g.139897  ORF g.139897 m.139897 type:complete len:218 (+) comp38288_c0_seq2:382-1035(+)